MPADDENPQSPPKRAWGQLPSLSDTYVGELRERGRWVVANLSGSLPWPTQVQKASYRSFDIFYLPPTQEEHLPALAVKVPSGALDGDARRAIMGFLSALCWVKQHAGARVEGWTGGSGPFRMLGRRPGMLNANAFELDYLPDPADPKARLALALCREAASINMATYAVISYFRVFETYFQGYAREIKDWLNANCPLVADRQAKEVFDRLKATEPNIGDYLHSACRSAAAHGKIGSQTVIDPDDPEDERRLTQDLPLIRAMAIKLTEEILGIQTTSTVYREHLYELAGFKPLFTQEALEAFAGGLACPEGQSVDLPIVNIGLSGKPPFAALSGLEPVHLQAVVGGAKVAFRRPDGLVEFHVLLDIKNERLEFEIERDLVLFDDGSPEAMEVAASAMEFRKFYYLNGKLRVVDTETGELLARKDAFVPVNLIVRPEGFDLEIKRYRDTAEHRRELGRYRWRARVSPNNVSYSMDGVSRPAQASQRSDSPARA
ncbi:methylamine utilization protein MauJ [Caulobacter segnis]|uniref:methylamine utilization protein MauJ n=1 Tax=Caulobacter segnis TaxID=88688 RepID=UPI0028638375|nr:methylamine utilization protein MauJ [Caulobacter segnis]MDR6624369.1 hypothetical protein [Caulobacter segnis]